MQVDRHQQRQGLLIFPHIEGQLTKCQRRNISIAPSDEQCAPEARVLYGFVGQSCLLKEQPEQYPNVSA